jgi:predicted DNA-binding antitoxin AbrB/MazE fold protein
VLFKHRRSFNSDENMGTRVKALYEEGVLKLLDQVSLKEGEELEIEIFPGERSIEEVFKKLKKVLPQLGAVIDLAETSPDTYMDKEYVLRKLGI